MVLPLLPPNSTLGPWPYRWVKPGLVVVLALLAAVVMGPAYGSGQWPWVTAPQVAHLDRMQPLRTDAFDLPDWSLTHHQVIEVNNKEWGLNDYRNLDPGAPLPNLAVLLYPQPWHSDQPQVEWVDLLGTQNWRVDARQRLELSPGEGGAEVQANFFRGWGDRQAFAVLQWYAWPQGGHPSPSRWFWANQRSQLVNHTLTPWVAITLLVPIDPLADIDTYPPLVAALGSGVHQRVMATLADTP